MKAARLHVQARMPPLAGRPEHAYTDSMKTMAEYIRAALPARLAALFLTALLAGLALAGCGPRDIGAGSSSDEERGAALSSAEQMRYPMTGTNNTQRKLYYNNQPDDMYRVQYCRINQFRRLTGGQPAPEDPTYRAVPKQRSPFRQ